MPSALNCRQLFNDGAFDPCAHRFWGIEPPRGGRIYHADPIEPGVERLHDELILLCSAPSAPPTLDFRQETGKLLASILIL
jgi:hypothetical protein